AETTTKMELPGPGPAVPEANLMEEQLRGRESQVFGGRAPQVVLHQRTVTEEETGACRLPGGIEHAVDNGIRTKAVAQGAVIGRRKIVEVPCARAPHRCLVDLEKRRQERPVVCHETPSVPMQGVDVGAKARPRLRPELLLLLIELQVDA